MADYTIAERAAQPSAVISLTTSMEQLGELAPPLNGEVFGWLAEHGAEPAGPPFWKYDRIDMPGSLDLQVGVTTAGPVTGDGRVEAVELPAGRYLEVLHRGHPATLEQATGDLLAHAESEGLTFDTDGDRWTARIEYYLTDPAEQPDMDQWETLLSFKLA